MQFMVGLPVVNGGDEQAASVGWQQQGCRGYG
jgi:hypothetical protein